MEAILGEEAARARKKEKRRRERMRKRIRQQQSAEAIGVKEVECTRFGTDLSGAVKNYLAEVSLPFDFFSKVHCSFLSIIQAAEQRRKRMGEMVMQEEMEISRLEKRLGQGAQSGDVDEDADEDLTD